MPALVLLKVPGIGGLGKHLIFVAPLSWIMVVVAADSVLLLSGIFSWNKRITECLLLMSALGNTAFLGIPMVRTFLEKQESRIL